MTVGDTFRCASDGEFDFLITVSDNEAIPKINLGKR